MTSMDLKKTVKRNLIFCKLYISSLHLVFYSDASFAGNLDLSSRTGGMILLKYKHGNAHVLHWFSKNCPCVTGSVLAAKVIGFVTAFDMASALRDMLDEIYQQSIPLYELTDSYSFFSTVTQYNALRKKRLSIEVAVVREAYAKFELANLGFVRTAYNLADHMTKHVKNTHLDKLLDTGVADCPVEEYVTRAQVTHDTSFDEADMPSVDVSIFFGSVCWNQGFMSFIIHGSSAHVMVLCFVLCSCHGIVFCAVHMSWFCVLCCVQGIVRVKAVCFVFWYKAWSCMIRSRIRGFL
jgi:hypothetical protein